MNNQYEYFLLVAQSLNMNKVAKEKFVSHQSVSSHINQLEEKLNVKLFYRKPRLSLTAEGEILFNGLRLMKALEESLISQLKDFDKNGRGKLRVGIPSSYYSIFVPMLLSEFKKIYPNVKIEVASDFSDILETQTLNGELDLFIGTDRVRAENLVTELLFTEKLFFVIGDEALKKIIASEISHETLAKLKQGVDFVDFKDVPLVLTPLPSRLRRMVDSIAEKNDCKLNIAFETNNVSMSIKLCKNEMWACIVSQLFMEDYVAGKHGDLSSLYYFPLKNVADHHGDISISYLADNRAPRYQLDFISITKKVFKQNFKCWHE